MVFFLAVITNFAKCRTLCSCFFMTDHNTSTHVTLGACNVVTRPLPQGEGVCVNSALSWLSVELRWLPHFSKYLDICQGLSLELEISFSCHCLGLHRQFYPKLIHPLTLRNYTCQPTISRWMCRFPRFHLLVGSCC